MAQGIEYYVRAVLDTKRAAGAIGKEKKWAAGLANIGNRMESVGRSIMGTSAATAMMFGKATAAAGALAGAYGFGKLISSAVRFNAELESSRFSIAATLQLMGHVGGNFERNLKISEALSDRIFKMAATSPASFAQAQTMFQNMLPGARAVTGNMEDILSLTKQSLALGIIMGGDFLTTGAQLSRILTGAAGAEFQTWKVLQTPILEAGVAMKFFNKNLMIGQDLTQQFNELSPEKRFDLVTKATERLGDATKAAGMMWMGMTSAIQSNLDLMRKAMGEGIFDVLKGRMMGAISKGGLMDPDGETLKKLTQMSKFIGLGLGRAADYMAVKLESATVYLANNWESILTKLRDWSERFGRIVKLMLAGAIARTAAGGGVMAGGMGLKAVGGVGSMVGALSKLGISALAAAPILLVAGMALTGVAAVFGGAAAYIIENFGEITRSFKEGTITFGPLWDVADLLWNKLKALGKAMFGGATATKTVNSAIFAMADGMFLLIGAFGVGLKVLGGFQFVFNAFTSGLRMLGLGILGFINGLLITIKGTLPGMVPGIDKAIAHISAGIRESAAEIKQDSKDATSMWTQADAFINTGFGEGKSALRAALEEAMKKSLDVGTDLGSETTGKGAKPRNVTHIHKMVVNQDLRNMDPDRVIGAFYNAVDRNVANRTQALSVQEQGI